MRLPRSAAAAVSAAALLLVLAGCAPDDSAVPDDSPTTVEQTTEPDPAETADTPVEEEPAADPNASSLSDDDYTNITESISSGNTAALESYLANPVNFIIAASECCGPVTPVDAISALDYLSGANGPWSVASDAQTAEFRDGPYGDYFPEGAFVLRSGESDPYVVSFTIAGEQITALFVVAGESLLY